MSDTEGLSDSASQDWSPGSKVRFHIRGLEWVFELIVFVFNSSGEKKIVLQRRGSRSYCGSQRSETILLC